MADQPSGSRHCHNDKAHRRLPVRIPATVKIFLSKKREKCAKCVKDKKPTMAMKLYRSYTLIDYLKRDNSHSQTGVHPSRMGLILPNYNISVQMFALPTKMRSSYWLLGRYLLVHENQKQIIFFPMCKLRIGRCLHQAIWCRILKLQYRIWAQVIDTA